MRRTAIIISGAITVAAGAALVAWQPWEPGLKNFGTVVEGRIYRMGRTTPAGLERLVAEKGIRTVIDFGSDPEGTDHDTREVEACAALGLERFTFRLEGDGTGDPNMYVDALRLMTDPAHQPILIHCGAGAQRTGAAAILYRHIVEGKPIIDVYPEAWKHRHEPGDDWRMLAYLADWSDEIAEAFRTGGRIVGPNQVIASALPEEEEQDGDVARGAVAP